MGVIHKLKPEIVDFIVQQKKDNPSLSCRVLSALVQETFEQKVSKSAVNKLLKESHLSSPVGRRGPSKKHILKTVKKRFSLPSRKSAELFEPVSQHHILSDLTPAVSQDNLIDGIGSILLKAAEWELARQPILEGVLIECCSSENEEKISDIASLLSYLKAFHVESLDGLASYEGKGLWEISSVGQKIRENDVRELVNDPKGMKELFLKFSLKIPTIFTQVLGFRYILKDGSSFFIDGQQASIWKNIQPGFSVSLTKATDILARMINNVHSSIFCSLSPKNSGKNQENIQISDFFKSFNNVHSKKIQSIELIGENNDVLGLFTEIPQIQRFFITAIWPWEDIFQKFLTATNSKSKGKIKHCGIGRDVHYKEVIVKWDFDGMVAPVRGVQLFEPFMNVPFVVLATNVEEEHVSAHDMVVQYFQRWPNMERGGCFSVLSNPSRWKTDSSTTKKDCWDDFCAENIYGQDPLWAVIDQLTFLLDRFVRQQFFPDAYKNIDFETMLHRFYSLPGRMLTTTNELVVDIQLPRASKHLRDFLLAAERVNESNVKTFEEKTLSINIL